MTQPVRDMFIGLISAVALLGLSTLLFLFGELDPIFNPRYPVVVMINDAGGLRPGSVVELNGVTVGVVETVTNEIDPDRRRLVRILALVQDHVRIPVDVEARIGQSLIGGGARLEFVSPEDSVATSVALLPVDGSATVTGRQRALIERMGDVLDERLGPLAGSLEGFEELTVTYTELGRNLNELVRPRTDGEAASEPNAREALARLNAMLEQARTATEKLNTTLDRYHDLADELAGSGRSAVQHLARASDDLSVTLEDVRRVAKLAADGEGTAGQLLTNPDLYNSLNDAAARLDRVLVQLQLLLEKIRAEGLRVGG